MAENSGKVFTNVDNQIIPRTQSAAAKPKSKLRAGSSAYVAPPTIIPSSTTILQNNSQPFKPEFQETTFEQIPMTTSQTFQPKQVVIENPTPVNTPSTTSGPSDANLSTSAPQSNTAPTTDAPKPKKKLALKKDAQEFNSLALTNNSASEQLFKSTQAEEKPVEAKGDWGQGPLKKNKSTDKSPDKLPSTNAKPFEQIEVKQPEPEKIEVKPEEKKPEPTPEQTFVPPQKEPEVVVKVFSRSEFEVLIEKLREEQKERALPEELQKITERTINQIKASVKPIKKAPMQNQNSNKDGNSMNQSTGNMRSDKQRRQPGDEAGGEGQGKPGMPNWRHEMTEEEKKKRKELQDSVGKWNAGIKVGDDQDEKNKREIRMNLNKLTPQNFDAVKEDIINIVCLKPEYVDKVAELIIENAWTQKKYANMYAKLCMFLGNHEKIPNEEGDGKKKRNKFKSATLKRIQRVFQNEEQIDVKINKAEEEMTKEEKIEVHDRKVKKILGNVCFIGELFLEKFIVIDIVRIITRTLLSGFLIEYDKYQKTQGDKPLFRNYEDTYEGLLKFYELIGREFEEKEKAKPSDKSASAKYVEQFEELLLLAHSSLEADEPLPALPDIAITLEDLFKIFDIIHEQANLTQRIKALISNLKHRKENNWNAPLYKNQGPQKIDEIHNEYHKELEQQERNKELYYEELNANRGKGRGGKGKGEDRVTYISYEIKAKPSQQTSNDDKIDLSNVKAENVVMKPQRGKQTDSKQTKEEIKNEEDELELIDGAKKDFKEIYDKVGDDTLEDHEAEVLELLNLVKERIRGKFLAIGYFSTFYDGKISSVNTNRVPLAKFLLEKGYISQEDFIQGFAEGSKDVYLGDFPQAGDFFATVFLEFSVATSGKYKLSAALPLPEEMPEDEDDESLDLHKEVVNKVTRKLSDAKYSNLKNALESDVKSLADKLKV